MEVWTSKIIMINTEISPLLGQIFDSDFWPSSLMIFFRLGLAMILFLVWVGSILGSIFLIHFFFSLPMRRAERARLFLDLVEGALKRGQSIEEMILSIAQSHDRTVGVRFHLLAAHIESGLHFVAALEKVPRFLSPQIAAMLRAGEKIGDLKSVLPACREILRDRAAAVRSAVNYLIVVILLYSPVFIFVLMMTTIFVIPRFREVAGGMGVQLWPLTLFVFANTGWLIAFEIIVTLMMILATLAYIGGPGFVRWFQFRGLPIVDWVAWRIPWKEKRLQRTFSAMLAVLLDAGVPETEAVRLAGDSTANEICRRRSQRVVTAIEQGTKLDDAVRAFDDSGEFHWRLTNATHSRCGFLHALRGWHEALDAKAFQQEEATAHVVTSGLVILNGVLVALIATAMFAILMAVLNRMAFTE
jgi:type II secretory pathway component PulF